MTDESVLIVEDEAIVALSIERGLRGLGYTVLESVATGEDAIAAVERQTPDLLLMDIHLHGGMDGIAAAAIIRKTYDVPVIFLTAYADDETVSRAVEAGAYGYLVKPFGERDLHSSIRLVLSRHRVEQQLKSQQALLTATNQELEAFCYSISQDLRAPLRAIDSYASILLDIAGDQAGGDETTYLTRIRNATRKMDDQISVLLTLFRLSQTKLCYEPVDISKMAIDILDELARTHPNRKVRIRVTPGIATFADRLLIRSACWNLIENAWKFTRTTEDAEIQVFSERKGGDLVIGVRDNGVGFDMALAEQLFTPFHRLHPTAEFPGTGVGLATVRRIVHCHGGAIWVESGPEEGTVFRFTLPERTSAGSEDDR